LTMRPPRKGTPSVDAWTARFRAWRPGLMGAASALTAR
jgi:hypothetical protein